MLAGYMIKPEGSNVLYGPFASKNQVNEWLGADIACTGILGLIQGPFKGQVVHLLYMVGT